MFYTVYKITNKINDKIYIGKHQTSNINDNYLGSGKLLRKAIEKYGKESFKKEILHVFDNEEDMNVKEAELVDEEFCLREDTYNICPGGKGGWGYVNNAGLRGGDGGQNFKSREWQMSMLQKRKDNPQWAKEWNKKISESLKGNPSPCGFLGKTHSDETKRKMSVRAKSRTGVKSSQYGTCWVYSLKEKRSLKIKKEDLDNYLDMGWTQGRKLKF